MIERVIAKAKELQEEFGSRAFVRLSADEDKRCRSLFIIVEFPKKKETELERQYDFRKKRK